MKIQFTETVLRDAQQSLMATRMAYSDFAGILETMDTVDYYSVECWGGATFDACLRYLHEDPWERLRRIRAKMPRSKLQMLLRGQSLLGYRHYPDDVVRQFVDRSIKNGIDIVRIFDALNDLRNIEVAVDQTIKSGGMASGAISYTTSPVHSMKGFALLAKEMENMGVSSVCIKDMAGVLDPQTAFDLVSEIKSTVKIPVVLHTHSTAGLAYMTYLKAVEAGVDVIDTATSVFSGGTSQPATESMVYALESMGYETGLEKEKLRKINDFFKPVRAKYIENGTLNPAVLGTATDALHCKIPGGMLSNLIAQLRAQNALDRLDEVLAETPKVRADLGYPPLVTPLSQMVGVQATVNVLLGERYKTVGKEIVDYFKGMYGKAPGKVNEDLKRKILGDEEPITCRYADLIEPGMEKAKESAGDLAESIEDVLSFVSFPLEAGKFFAYRKEQAENRAKYTIEAIE